MDVSELGNNIKQSIEQPKEQQLDKPQEVIKRVSFNENIIDNKPEVIQQPTQQPQMRKKGESLSQSIRKLEDGRPYPSDYSTNSLKYILLFKNSLLVTCLILNLVIIMKVNHNSIIVFLVI